MNSRMTVVLTPEDVLTSDSKTSLAKIDRVLSRYFPGNSGDKAGILYALQDVANNPGAASALPVAPQSGCLILFSRDRQPGNTYQILASLPESYIRPEKLKLIDDAGREFTLAHEAGHCDLFAAAAGNNRAVEISQYLAREAGADRAAFAKMQEPDAVQAIADARAIHSLYSFDYRTQVRGDGQAFIGINDHATTALVLRPQADPLAALVAPALVNAAVFRLAGLSGGAAGDPAEWGQIYLENAPLLHYAAARALLEEGLFAADSLGYMYAAEYTAAVGRMVRPDLLKGQEPVIDALRDIIRNSAPGEREKLSVTKEAEDRLAQAALDNPLNIMRPEPSPAP